MTEFRMGSMQCPHCQKWHPSAEMCDCEGANAARTRAISDLIDKAQMTEHMDDCNIHYGNLCNCQPTIRARTPARASDDASERAFVWDTDRLDAVFRRASEKHGHLETLIAVAAEGVRIAEECRAPASADAMELEAAIAACEQSACSQFGASGPALNKLYAAARKCAAKPSVSDDAMEVAWSFIAPWHSALDESLKNHLTGRDIRELQEAAARIIQQYGDQCRAGANAHHEEIAQLMRHYGEATGFRRGVEAAAEILHHWPIPIGEVFTAKAVHDLRKRILTLLDKEAG